ncbi:BirA family biotin operon repressor/biotin-[acetyl-CoA-carboxylase] ligase [Frondihabitans sp. PhB188]|uniref:biotin--[acetyl-CoA-carboxylase] ligase n=1 Tax=Frondihabitans sp. PhB188 TaxID=2485200 RepID=UPI000FAB89D4|nr:biotin--[acetyl-CoA-carboxylase] ligase [Frondihabitans sp. PhB188]ROQ36663.1 BirA family biotin operon repressor/biotin-[acetyl-CoA-carboxylase] ligase [Frondihabitans sp. PhB188]
MSGILPITRGVASVVDLRATTGSTNADLVEAAPGLPDFAVIVSFAQTSGRGRLDRSWQAPAGQSLAASVLLRPRTPSGDVLPVDAWGWFSLLAGAALRTAVADLLPERSVTLKWPNDVQVSGWKVSGLLADLVWESGVPAAVVMGSGINLTIPPDALPTPTSTSLAIEGAAGSAEEIADAVFAAYLIELRRLVDLLAGGGDVRSVVEAQCDTVGRRVRVELPGGEMMHGTATGLDETGRIVVRKDDSGAEVAVAAGDVTHLRYE